MAKRLLRDRLGEEEKEALLNRNLMSYFTALNNWQQEIYETLPKLKYLALRNCLMVDDLVKVLLQTPIMEKLAVLDFYRGGMTERGVQYILDSHKLTNLKLLNITGNSLSSQVIEQLKKLPFKIESAYPNHYSRSYE